MVSLQLARGRREASKQVEHMGCGRVAVSGVVWHLRVPESSNIYNTQADLVMQCKPAAARYETSHASPPQVHTYS
jgi:hypothetical protein